LILVSVASTETYWGPEYSTGSVYSLNLPVSGKKRKILFLEDSVPTTTTDPEIVANAKLVGVEPAVGIAHSRKVSVDGSR
jgi:hypothetical protein